MQSDADGCNTPADGTDLFASLQAGVRAKWFVTLLGADHLGPYEGVAPWASVVDAVTTKFFEHELHWRSASSSAASIETAGALSGVQLTVAAVTLTLFLPCIAQFVINVKERGIKWGVGISAFILVFSFAVGVGLNALLHALGIVL